MRAAALILSVAALSPMAGRAHADDALRNMDQVGAAIRACWKAPPGPDGSFVTLSFGFNRDGSLLGPPQVTAINLPGADDQARRKFIEAARTGLMRCGPLHLAPALGNNIAGQVFTMQFFATGKRGGQPDTSSPPAASD